MSKTLLLTKLTDGEIKEYVGVFKNKCRFSQRAEKKKSGYYFESVDIEGKEKINGVETKDDQTIYAVSFSVKKNEDDGTHDLTIRVPYFIGRIFQEKMKEIKFNQNKSTEQYKPSKPASIKNFSNNLKFNGYLREYQRIDCPKIIERMKEVGSCYFVADPGYGKTVVMCYVLSCFQSPALVVVPTVDLARQSQKELTKRFPTAKIIVYELKQNIPDDVDVVITYSQRIDGRADLFGRFEVVVLDEIHLLSSRVALASILSTSPKRVLGLTATPGDRDAISQMIVGPQTFTSVYVKKWYLCFPKVYTDLDNSNYQGQTGYTNAINDITNCEAYMEKIICIIKYFRLIDERIILITMRTDARDQLADKIKKEIGCSIGVLSTENKECPNADIIAGTYKMIGTGFDLTNYVADFDGKQAGVMIFLGSIKDKTLMHQISGRAFRSELSLAIFPVIQEINMFKNHETTIREEVSKIRGCQIKDEYGDFLSSLEPSDFKT